jgi:phage tail-like protein
MTRTGERIDPYCTFNFLIEVSGLTIGGFTEVSGLSIQTDYDTIKEGGENNFEHRLPKGTKSSDITLKRGLVDPILMDWYSKIINGNVERKNGSIILCDRYNCRDESHHFIEWQFFEAYPVKWEGPAFNASNNTIASETLVLTHHGITKKIMKDPVLQKITYLD